MIIYRINLQIYFNHVVYGISRYVRPKIKNKLVGPTKLKIPYIPWNNIATAGYIDSSVIKPAIGEKIPIIIHVVSTFKMHPSNANRDDTPKLNLP